MHPRFPIGRLQGGGRLRFAIGWLQSGAGMQAARSSERTQDSLLEGFKAACGQAARSSEPRFPIGRLEGGAGRLPAAV